jgi:hypothetical protein
LGVRRIGNNVEVETVVRKWWRRQNPIRPAIDIRISMLGDSDEK